MEQDGPAKRTRSLTGVGNKGGRHHYGHREIANDFAFHEREGLGSPTQINAESVRPKTPSGNTITSSVKDIRNFFLQQQNTREKAKYANVKKSGIVSSKAIKVSAKVSKTTKGVKECKKSSKQKKSTKQRARCENTKQSSDRSNNRLDKIDEACAIQECERNQHPILKEVQSPDRLINSTSRQFVMKETKTIGINLLMDKCGTNSQTGEGAKQTEEDADNQTAIVEEASKEEPNIKGAGMQNKTDLTPTETETQGAYSGRRRIEPEVMDLKTVIQMFQEIKNDIKDIKSNKCKERMNQLDIKTQRHEETFKEVSAELTKYKLKMEVLTGVVKRMSTEMLELKEQMDNLRQDSMRNMIAITGFEGSPKNKTSKQQLEDFMSKEMGVEITILDLFQIGAGTPKTVVITVSNREEKAEINQAVRNIKHLVNSHGKKYFFRDYLPPARNERKRRQAAIFAENNKSEVNKVEMTWANKELSIKGQPYHKKITAPDVNQILSMSQEEIEDLLSIKMDVSDELHEQDSVFVAYTFPAGNYDEISHAYLKLKLIYPDARHITCAYLLPGVDTYHCRDYYDNEEHGMGENAFEDVRTTWHRKQSSLCNQILQRENWGKKIPMHTRSGKECN